MPWTVVTQEDQEIEGRSSPMFSRCHALAFACRLVKDGVKVIRVEGFGQEIDAEDNEAWSLERRSAR